MSDVALGVLRALDYTSIALLLGTLAFLRVGVAPVEDSFRAAFEGAFALRVRRLLGAAVALGVTASVAAVLLQRHGLGARPGWVWAAEALVWLLVGAALLGRSRAATRCLVLAGALCLAAAPGLLVTAAIPSPAAVLLVAVTAHVLAASVWVGGIAVIAIALPAAVHSLEPERRTALLAATLGRFSPLAFAAVLVIALTGVVQAYIEVRTQNALFHTTFGAFVLLKTGLLGILIGLGAANRERVVPTLTRLAGAGSPPGQAGALLGRVTRAELAAMAALFAITATLVAYTPPVDAAGAQRSLQQACGYRCALWPTPR